MNLAIDRVVQHAVTLDARWQFLNDIFPMVLGLLRQVRLKLLLRVRVDVTDCDWVEVVRLPVLFRGLCLEDLLVHLHLFLVVLQIAVVDHVVVSLVWCLDGLASDSLNAKKEGRIGESPGLQV